MLVFSLMLFFSIFLFFFFFFFFYSLFSLFHLDVITNPLTKIKTTTQQKRINEPTTTMKKTAGVTTTNIGQEKKYM